MPRVDEPQRFARQREAFGRIGRRRRAIKQRGLRLNGFGESGHVTEPPFDQVVVDVLGKRVADRISSTRRLASTLAWCMTS